MAEQRNENSVVAPPGNSLDSSVNVTADVSVASVTVPTKLGEMNRVTSICVDEDFVPAMPSDKIMSIDHMALLDTKVKGCYVCKDHDEVMISHPGEEFCVFDPKTGRTIFTTEGVAAVFNTAVSIDYGRNLVRPDMDYLQRLTDAAKYTKKKSNSNKFSATSQHSGRSLLQQTLGKLPREEAKTTKENGEPVKETLNNDISKGNEEPATATLNNAEVNETNSDGTSQKVSKENVEPAKVTLNKTTSKENEKPVKSPLKKDVSKENVEPVKLTLKQTRAQIRAQRVEKVQRSFGKDSVETEVKVFDVKPPVNKAKTESKTNTPRKNEGKQSKDKPGPKEAARDSNNGRKKQQPMKRGSGERKQGTRQAKSKADMTKSVHNDIQRAKGECDGKIENMKQQYDDLVDTNLELTGQIEELTKPKSDIMKEDPVNRIREHITVEYGPLVTESVVFEDSHSVLGRTVNGSVRASTMLYGVLKSAIKAGLFSLWKFMLRLLDQSPWSTAVGLIKAIIKRYLRELLFCSKFRFFFGCSGLSKPEQLTQGYMDVFKDTYANYKRKVLSYVGPGMLCSDVVQTNQSRDRIEIYRPKILVRNESTNKLEEVDYKAELVDTRQTNIRIGEVRETDELCRVRHFRHIPAEQCYGHILTAPSTEFATDEAENLRIFTRYGGMTTQVFRPEVDAHALRPSFVSLSLLRELLGNLNNVNPTSDVEDIRRRLLHSASKVTTVNSDMNSMLNSNDVRIQTVEAAVAWYLRSRNQRHAPLLLEDPDHFRAAVLA